MLYKTRNYFKVHRSPKLLILYYIFYKIIKQYGLLVDLVSIPNTSYEFSQQTNK